jgi:predicted amidohydrolase
MSNLPERKIIMGKRGETSRRGFLGGVMAAGAALGLKGQAAQDKKEALSMSPDGVYQTVPLTKQTVTLGVVQSRIRSFEVANKQVLKDNLAHTLELIDKAFYYGSRPDILFFHEFPVTGWRKWTRKEILTFALELPGPESEAIAKKAKEYGCYIVFGTYAKDKDWPGHVLSITVIIGPDGNIVDKHWKARNIKGVFPGFELFTTTIYDVLDRYVEMYGPDRVIPIARTPYGNITTSSTQNEPEIFRAMAMKGAEIILRTASGGFTPMDVQATAMYNGVYVAVCNNAVSPENPGFFDDAGSGNSAIYAPGGAVMAEANTKFETMLTARIPIADFRARHRQPIVHSELFMPVYQKYQNAYGPNLFTPYQPESLEDAKRYLNGKSRWK